MEFLRKVDMHTHTDNSPDGIHSTMYMCEQAQMHGLRAVAFTDHCEVDAYYRDNYDKSTVQAYFEVAKARNVYSGRLLVLEGIELGQAPYEPELAEKSVGLYRYDIVIGSIHNLRGREDFWTLPCTQEDVVPLLTEYFDEIEHLVDWGHFDTLAHLTYPLRYMVGEHGLKVDLAQFSKKIDAILMKLAASGKALDINTSGLRQPIGRTLPDADIVRRFRELGGEHITVGSDAHRANDIGAGIERGMEIAKACGFDHVTIFQDRAPVLIPIE